MVPRDCITPSGVTTRLAPGVLPPWYCISTACCSAIASQSSSQPGDPGRNVALGIDQLLELVQHSPIAAKANGADLDDLGADRRPFFSMKLVKGQALSKLLADREKLDYAVKLRPDLPEYLVAKADLLQSQLKLAEAAATYRTEVEEISLRQTRVADLSPLIGTPIKRIILAAPIRRTFAYESR